MRNLKTFRSLDADEARLEMIDPLGRRPTDKAGIEVWEKGCDIEGDRIARFLTDHLPWEVMAACYRKLTEMRDVS